MAAASSHKEEVGRLRSVSSCKVICHAHEWVLAGTKGATACPRFEDPLFIIPFQRGSSYAFHIPHMRTPLLIIFHISLVL